MGRRLDGGTHRRVLGTVAVGEMARGERYADTVRRLRGVMDALEGYLAALPDGSRLTAADLQRGMPGPRPGHDQDALALLALADLGIVDSEDQLFDRDTFLTTADLRAGVRLGLDNARVHESPATARLALALPGGLPSAVQAALGREATDLRAAIVDMIASARAHLLVASPFWDDETGAELGDVLARRLDAGIQVDLLGRPARPGEGGFATIAERLAAYQTCRAFSWYVPMADDRFGAQTFHFKCIVADRGARAYIGSANFTTASLRSRMEMGVLLTGDEAMALARVMASILAVTRRVARSDRQI